MKARIKITPTITSLIIVFILLLLGGCVQTLEKFQTDMAAKGVQPLTVTELKTAFVEHTMLGNHPKYDWARYIASDGTIKSRAWGTWGEETSIGKWWINEEGMLCVNNDNDKYNYGDRCSIVYPGKSKDKYTHIIAIGKKTNSVPSGIYKYKVVPGDQSGVK